MIAELSIRKLRKAVLCFLLFWLSTSFVTAHPFTYSICKLYIGDQYISGNLEVSAENLLFFNYLNVDSSNYFSSYEILKAAEAYQSSLSTSIVINTGESDLRIEDFKLGDFSIKEQISISELKETFIHYSFKIKLDQTIDQLGFTHKIGAEYPLISSLLILEIEGRDVEKTFDNLAINKLYEFSFMEKKKMSLTSLFLESGEKSTMMKLSTSEAFLEYAGGGVDNSLNGILTVKYGEVIMPFSNIGLERTPENDILITAEILHVPGSNFVLEWKKFNLEVKSIPGVLILNDIKREFVLSRYERSVSW